MKAEKLKKFISKYIVKRDESLMYHDLTTHSNKLNLRGKKCESNITSNESCYSFDPHPFDHKVSSKMFPLCFPTEVCIIPYIC